MNKYIAILLLAFSGSAFASTNEEKIELVCDGKISNYKDDMLDVGVEDSVVVVNFKENTVNITGELGGTYQITKITNERVSFISHDYKVILVGGINRYTGSVIIHNDIDSTNKLLYHLSLNCKASKRLF